MCWTILGATDRSDPLEMSSSGAQALIYGEFDKHSPKRKRKSLRSNDYGHGVSSNAIYDEDGQCRTVSKRMFLIERRFDDSIRPTLVGGGSE